MGRAWSRRRWLTTTSTALSAGLVAAAPLPARERSAKEPFGYCLNTSTLMGQKLDLVELIEIAAKAGYQALEPWMQDVEQFVSKGGDLKALGQRLRDRGLSVPSAIGFAEWIVEDAGRRQKALEQVRRHMGLLQQLGGQRLAAPPAGAIRQALDLRRVAERYRALLELGDRTGIVPQLELWGFSRVLSRLGETALVAIESGHPRACLLLDVYHLYKGGSSLTGLRLLNGAALHVLHFNDYPAEPPREAITDAQRVYPGDGVAPLPELVRDLGAIGFRGMLSLELFNRAYWKQDPLTVARTGLAKMRAVVRSSFA